MYVRYLLLSLLIGLSVSSCLTTPASPHLEAKSVGPTKGFPLRERRQAEHLLRIIYAPSSSSYSLELIPDEPSLKQTPKDLRDRLNQIRAVPGNATFKFIIADKTGAALSTLSGVLQRESGDIRYTTDKKLLNSQSINVRLKFLAWYDHTSVISFCDYEADNFRSGNFKTVHDSRTFKMTHTAEAIVDPPFTKEE